MRRLLPGGLTGRITLILTLGLFSAQGIALWLFFHDHMSTSMTVFGLSFADRVVTITDTLDSLPPDEQSKFLEALNSRSLQVGVLETPPPRPQHEAWHTEDIRQDVRSHLQSQFNRPTQVQVLNRWTSSPLAELDNAAIVPLLPSRKTMVIAIQQTNDSWLVFVSPSDVMAPRSGRRLWLSFLLGGMVIWLLSIWAARRVTQPIHQFATAAEQFGRDINVPPLPERGSRELRRSIRAFNQMQERLRHLVNERTFMLAAIAHDLRTVLTRLKLRTEFIADGEQAQKAIADIDQMQAMLTETLTFVQEESATEPFVKLDLAELLQSLCDDWIDAGRPASYRGPAHFTYLGQPTALRRAFMNLIHNAVTYGGEAEVVLRTGQESVEVMIGDRGPGIPLEFQEKIFEPFFRLEQSRSRETGGTGLGLTVAKTIIQRHKGDITFAERVKGGLQVHVNL